MSVPATIGKYEVIREIGRGGMGAVFLARDRLLDRLVALKTLFVGGWAEEEARERFLREARSAARLQHPNIVTIFELGEIDAGPFIAMELLEGQHLGEALEGGRLPRLADKLKVVEQLCRGLAHAHRHGVIHRDVKPSNVIVLDNGTVKVVDFGIARFEGSTFATRTGDILGTPWYMAPEQFADERLDHKVDIWAVGVILYELLAGRRPFDGSTVPSLIYRIVHTPLPPIDAAALRIPAQLARIVERALAKEPEARCDSLETMAAELAALAGGPAPSAAGDPTEQLSAAEVRGLREEGAARADVLQSPATERVSPVTRMPLTPYRMEVFREAGMFGEAGAIRVITATPDDRLLAVGGVDGAIRLWDLEGRTKLATLRSRMHLRTGHGALTTALAISPDGAFLVSGHLDGAIYLWQLETGLELEVALHHDGAVGGLGFTPDVLTLASGGMDGSLKLWEMPTLLAGDARRLLRHNPAPVTCLAVDPAGGCVATGHGNRSIRIHDLHSGRLQATLHGHRQAPSSMVIAAGGELLACGARDGVVRVFRLASREQTAVLQGHSRSISSLAFFPDGRWLAAVAQDNALLIWDVTTGAELTTLSGGVGESFVSVCLTDRGRTVLCGLTDGRVRVWEAVGQGVGVRGDK